VLVDIDEEKILREFDAQLAMLGPEAIEGELITNRTVSEWLKLVKPVKAYATKKLMPAWVIEPEDSDGFDRAASDTLEMFWPGGVANIDNWSPWARLAWFSLMIVLANFDIDKMEFKPLQLEAPKPAPAAGQGKNEGENNGNG